VSRSELPEGISGSVWPEPVRDGFGIVIGAKSHRLIFGLSPRLSFDDGYRSYLMQISEQTGSAMDRVSHAIAAVAIDAERQLALKALEEASRTKDEFLAMLGHELRNPLAPISSALDLMAHHDPAGTSARERSVIERQVRHMVRLVDDLLDIARITSRSITLDRRVVDLAGIVTAAVEVTARLMKEHGHRVVIEARPGLRASADESRVLQIAVNLLTNAAKYTPDGGQIHVTLRGEGREAVFQVADTGIGSPRSYSPRCSIPSYKAPRASIVHRAASGSGSRSSRTSSPFTAVTLLSRARVAGREVCSRFVCPSSTTRRATRLVRPLAISPRGSSKRVLVVDDNEDAAGLTGDLLRTRGHEVIVANDPVQALHDAEAFHPRSRSSTSDSPGFGRLRAGRADAPPVSRCAR